MGSRRPGFKCLLGSFPGKQHLDALLNLPALINRESNRSRVWYAESKYSKKWWLFKKKNPGAGNIGGEKAVKVVEQSAQRSDRELAPGGSSEAPGSLAGGSFTGLKL